VMYKQASVWKLWLPWRLL